MGIPSGAVTVSIAAVHPIERLRYVARAGDVPVEPLVRESAAALATFADDPSALSTACRRLLERRPGSAPLVWLCARMLSGVDPRLEARDAAEAIAADPTDAELAHALPDDTTVCLVGGGEIVGRALLDRPDVAVLLVDPIDRAPDLLRLLDEAGHTVVPVPTAALESAVVDADLLVLEALAAGPRRVLAPAGSLAAAAVASHRGIPTWATVGVGRRLPDAMWPALGLPDTTGRFDADVVEVPVDLVDVFVTPAGCRRGGEVVGADACPVVTALVRGERPGRTGAGVPGR